MRKLYEKHRMTKSPEYGIWKSMINRCTLPNAHAYHRYGGRGITVCDRWLNSFTNFYEDMGKRPSGLTLDRVDNEKGYSPENCKWATKYEQRMNSSQHRKYFYMGRYYTLKDLCLIAGKGYSWTKKKRLKEKLTNTELFRYLEL